jgi:ABC-2 type transport system ATP-binding protein
VLEVDGLVRRYGPVTALDGMTFRVAPGSVTGFLGPNGAGKTTTMRAVFGLTALDAGAVRFDGGPIDMDVRRRRFGYLPEERGLYPTMKNIEQLSFLGALRGMDRREAAREARGWLERLGLADRVDDELEDLSLGNQQRVQLISALLHRPDVLILDEPFSGLDPVAVDALSKVLVGEARRGATVLFSSHQLDLVEDLCERAVIVDHGRAVTTGTIDELTSGADPVLEIDVPSDPDGAWTHTLGEAPVDVISVQNGRVRMALRPGPGPAAERAGVVLDVARRAGPVNHFAFDRRSLAEVFLTLVGRPPDESTEDGGRGGV